MILTKKCRECGKKFEGGPRAWYCPECREKRHKIAKKEYENRKRLGKSDVIGTTKRKCEVCGKEYIIDSARQKYCPDCAKEAVKAVDRQQGLEYYYDNKEQINPARYERRRKKTAVCTVCGQEFDPEGTARSICSDKCKAIRQKDYEHRAEAKRKEKKKHSE